MKNIFKKKETDEEVVELTEEQKAEKKAKFWNGVKKFGIGVGTFAAGAATVLFAANKLSKGDADTSDDARDSCDCDVADDGASEE